MKKVFAWIGATILSALIVWSVGMAIDVTNKRDEKIQTQIKEAQQRNAEFEKNVTRTQVGPYLWELKFKDSDGNPRRCFYSSTYEPIKDCELDTAPPTR